MPNKRLDLKGVERGYLTAVCPVGASRRGVVWLIRCRCGTELRKPAVEFVRHGRKHGKETTIPSSCGCYLKDKNNRGAQYKGVGDLSRCRWLNVLGHAKRKGLPVEITIEQAWQQFLDQDKRCALTGLLLVMSPSSMAAGASTASLDRKDSTKGYVPGNIQWVHLVIQDMKSNFSQEEFVEWCSLVARNMRQLRLVG